MGFMSPSVVTWISWDRHVIVLIFGVAERELVFIGSRCAGAGTTKLVRRILHSFMTHSIDNAVVC